MFNFYSYQCCAASNQVTRGTRLFSMNLIGDHSLATAAG